jgi:hypothetical protein
MFLNVQIMVHSFKHNATAVLDSVGVCQSTTELKFWALVAGCQTKSSSHALRFLHVSYPHMTLVGRMYPTALSLNVTRMVRTHPSNVSKGRVTVGVCWAMARRSLEQEEPRIKPL